MADPKFNISRPVDILLGAESFYSLLSVGQHKLNNGPILQETKFGWIISGPITYQQKINHSVCNLSTLDVLLQNFWQLETCDNKSNLTKTQTLCEEHFDKTITRNNDGRFVATLPIDDKKFLTLGNSRDIALKRFYNIERKLHKNLLLRNQYIQFMNEYKNLGHMRLVENPNKINDIEYFLPHHAVVKDSSLTTKLRVVFLMVRLRLTQVYR